jgi:hypothetical protein
VGASEEVGPERAALGVESLGTTPQVEEDLLGDLLGRRVAADHPSSQGVHGAGVATVDLGEGGLMPAGDPEHQAGVARLWIIHDHALYSGDPKGPDE